MATTFQAELDVKKGDIFRIYPEKLIIIEDKKHPRYDPRAALPVKESMIETILQYGVIEPIVCNKNEDGLLEVVEGRQRVKACRMANKRIIENGGSEADFIRIPFTLKNEDEATLEAIANLTNSVYVPETVWEKIVKFNRLIDTFGHTVKEAATIKDVSLPTAYMWQKVIQLPKKLQLMIAQEKISYVAALDLAEDEDWEAKLSELLETGKASAARVKKAVATGDCQRHRSLPFKKLESFLSEKKELKPDVIKGIQFAMGILTEADL